MTSSLQDRAPLDSTSSGAGLDGQPDVTSRPAAPKCSEPGCEADAQLRGACRKHYYAAYNAVYYRENRDRILAHLRRYRPTRSKNVPINQTE